MRGPPPAVLSKFIGCGSCEARPLHRLLFGSFSARQAPGLWQLRSVQAAAVSRLRGDLWVRRVLWTLFSFYVSLLFRWFCSHAVVMSLVGFGAFVCGILSGQAPFSFCLWPKAIAPRMFPACPSKPNVHNFLQSGGMSTASHLAFNTR